MFRALVQADSRFGANPKLLYFKTGLLEWKGWARLVASQGRQTMKATLIGAFGGAMLVALVGAFFGHDTPAFAQRPAGFDSSPELITLATQIDNVRQQLTVIDPRTQVMSVYHLELPSGKISLLSVRNIHWDLQMIEFNGVSPLPSEIRAKFDSR